MTTPLHPSKVSGLQNWYDAADPLGTGTAPSNGTAVTQWKDKSGNARHSTGSSGVISYNNDGTPYLQFPVSTGGFYSVPEATWMSNSYFTVFTVETPANLTDMSILGPVTQTANGFGEKFCYYYESSGTLAASSSAFGRSSGINDPIPFNTATTYINCYTATDQSTIYTQDIFTNGRLHKRKTDYSTFPTSNFFGHIGRYSGTNIYKGRFREIIFIKGNLSSADRINIEGYLAIKWNLASQLPTTHPFYSATISRIHPGIFSISQLQNWYDASDPLGTGTAPSNDTTISVWKDKSGNSKDTTGGSGDVKYNNDGTPYLQFSSSGSWYSIPQTTWMNNSYFTIFSVETPDTFVGNTILGSVDGVDTTANTNIQYKYSDSTNFSAGSINGGINNVNGAPFTSNTTYLNCYTTTSEYNTFTQQLYINGKLYKEKIDNNTLLNGNVSAYIGKAGNVAEQYKGRMREIICIKGLVSPIDRYRIEGYLATKWNLTGQLPATHPFYSGTIIGANPFTLPGLQNWYDASDPIGTGSAASNSTTLTQWRDKSGRANHTTGSSGDIQCNNDGTPYLQFSTATGSWYSIPEAIWMYNSYFTVFSVESPAYLIDTTILGAALQNDSGNGSKFVFFYESSRCIGAGTVYGRSTGINDPIPFVENNTYINCYTATDQATTLTQDIYTNGRLHKRKTDYSTFPTANFFGHIGRYAANPYKGRFREIIAIKGILSSVDRIKIEGYLAEKWNLTAKLPTNHTYYRKNIPGKPTAVLAIPGNASATVSWTAPTSYIDSPITGYTITPSVGSPVTVGNVLSSTVTGLTNGTAITFNIKAINIDGTSPASVESAAVTPSADLPGAPTAVSAVAANASATVSWTAPASNGGSAITGYTVIPSTGSSVTVGNVLTTTLTNLTNGTALTFRVLAINSTGNSSFSSPSASVTPSTVPDAPTGVSAVRGNTSATVTWVAPASNGGATITGYTVTPSVGSPVTVGNVLSTGIGGLTNGTAVTFTVVATNSRGNSLPSSASAAVIPATVPDAPTGVSAVAGNTSATVSWTAPVSTGGSEITGYRVIPSTGTAVTVGNVLTASITGLTNGTSTTFIVYAINSVGNSSNSSASAAITPATVPGAPTGVSAVAGNASAIVSWTAPASNGGLAITGYRVTPSVGSQVTVGNVLTARLSLTNETALTFTVVAINSVGPSVDSSASTTITPTAALPDVPTGVSAVAGNASATVSWTAPASDGGSAITAYTLTSSSGSSLTVGNVLTASFTGLTNGTAVTFTVKATNSTGSSLPSLASTSVTPITVPGAPTGVSAVAGNASSTVTWTAPASNGGSAVTGYTVTSSTGVAVTVGNVLTTSVTGLVNGTPVTFTVVATNAAGPSLASSASASVTPATVAGAPTGVSAVRGNASAVVTWTAPASDGGSAITGYRVTPSTGSALTVGNVLTATLTGLTNGTSTTFTVIAINSAGNSLASAASAAVTPATVPGAPTGVSAVAGTNSATVSWAAPASNGGSVVTGYTVTPSVGSPVSVGAVLTAAFTGLTGGTPLTFTVIATNALGSSLSSSASASVTPLSVAGSPTAVSAVAGNASATVTWTAPASNGGSAITGYTVTSSSGSSSILGNVLTTNFTGLTNGTSVTFTVVARNSIGNSLPSSASAPVTPVTVPGAPTGVSAVAGNASATVSWTAPASDGGSAITGYTVTPSVGSPVILGNVLTATLSNLTNGTAITFTVVARNAVGSSTSSSASASVTPVTVPDAPTDVSAVASNASAILTWTAPASNGGAAITEYTVTPSVGSPVTVGNVLTASFSNLTNGTPLTFTVKAKNSVGSSLPSLASASVTPSTVPDAPTGVSAVPGDSSATVSWTAPSDGGSQITEYTVTPSVGSPVTVGNVLTATLSNLTNGTPLTFTVKATNSRGSSLPSSASGSVTPATVADAPTGVSAVAGMNSATVSWTAPSSNGGSAITGYRVTPSLGSPVTVGNVLTATLTGLASGSPVTFTVVAINSAGSSLPSSASASVTPTASPPGVPTSVTAVAGNTSATVSWIAPTSTGDSAITGYTVTSSTGTSLTVGNVLTATLTGLDGETSMTFTVIAINSGSNSLPSSPSAAIIPAIVAGTPTGVSAVAGINSATVSWTAPASTGGSPITGYRVTPSTGSPLTVGNVLTATLSGLDSGAVLTFTVVAINAIGSSPPSSTSSSVTLPTTPGAPTAVSAVAGVNSATVSWTAPASNGGLEITGYTVKPSVGASLTVGNVLSATLSGLDSGAVLTFTVVAINAVGDSSASSASSSITTPTVPGAPTAVSAVAGINSTSVSWTAPASNGGSAITGYRVTPSVGSQVTVGNVLTTTLIGLFSGTAVTFTVLAINAVGNSLPSAASSPVTPPTVPGAPTGVSAVAGNASATVTWTAPASNGGLLISGYTVTSSAGVAVTVGNVLTATFSNLTDGTALTFTVIATNAVGNSSASSASSSVTPLIVPGAPIGVSAIAGTNSATVYWTAPASNGGSEITGYTVTPSVGAAVTVGNVLTATLSGLAGETPVTFTVVAINAVGSSIASLPSSEVTPITPSSAPPSGVLGVTGIAAVASATISWNAPVSSGGSPITGYKVICVPDNKKPNLAGPNDRSLVLTGLKNAAAATFTVVAINDSGQSDSVILTPYPLPGVPKVTAVRGASGVINLTWTATPSNVASPITGYIVSLVSPAAPVGMVIPTPSVTATGGSVSVSGLTNGDSYVFSVKSVSNIGQSAGGLSKALIAAGLPNVPTSFAGTRGLASAQLSWVAPTNTGGLPITGYTISYALAGVVRTVAVKVVTSTIIKGLVNGTAYSFTIKATTLVGSSVESAAVVVTPGTGL